MANRSNKEPGVHARGNRGEGNPHQCARQVVPATTSACDAPCSFVPWTPITRPYVQLSIEGRRHLKRFASLNEGVERPASLLADAGITHPPRFTRETHHARRSITVSGARLSQSRAAAGDAMVHGIMLATEAIR
jgi:hypothetical protein